ncbi:hypothetical protein [uncultured Sphingomonas sp.]|uniref:hypothetical protein n=1 Tax=uncultured Sphingomonas sp. TaxID=158754 RepID=UPI0025D528E5|nr:hypothetical protein [uncultured Sphingomonas sp.]
MAAVVRKRISEADAIIRPPAAFGRAKALSGVRVYDVGQGDAIAVLDQGGVPVLQIDYGGRQGSPFRKKKPSDVDVSMPVASDTCVMLTHWDEDHWSSAPKGDAARKAEWLVPRQVTSPRAVRFSAGLARAACVPETRVGRTYAFRAANGDTLLFQKIRHSAVSPAQDEDCNRSGVALALVRGVGSDGQVILLPGDASFGWVPLYRRLHASGRSLTGLVAFHHGAGTHWTRSTRALLRDWRHTSGSDCQVMFSCSSDNGYGHPQPDLYSELMNISGCTTFSLRAAGRKSADILFR